MIATHNPIAFDKENAAGGVMRTKQAQKPGLTRGRSFGVAKNQIAAAENGPAMGKSKAKATVNALQRTRSALGDITNTNAAQASQSQNKKVMKQVVVTKAAVKLKAAHAEESDWAYPLPLEKPYEDPFIENIDLPALCRMPAVSFDFGMSSAPNFEDEEIRFAPADDAFALQAPAQDEETIEFWGIPAPIEVAIEGDF